MLDLGRGVTIDAPIPAEMEMDPALLEQSKNIRYVLSPSQFAETKLFVRRDMPMSFEGREYLREPYDVDATEVLMFQARQTEKSTTLANKLVTFSVMWNGLRALYVSPSDRQTKTFSFERIRNVLLSSPSIAAYVNKGTLSVYDNPLLNGSLIKLRSAYLSADRVRGDRGDVIALDEYQNLLQDNIPVILECAFHAEIQWRRFLYGGTAMTMDNPIQKLWKQSSMTELMFPCRKHGLPNSPWTWHWFPITLECIGKDGLICPKCGGSILWNDPQATWVDTAPEKREFRGYHIPQPVTPMCHRVAPNGKRDWDQLLLKIKRYPRAKLHNEVFCESFDYGSKPITETELIASQVSGWTMSPEQLMQAMQMSGEPVYAGIDWGGKEEDRGLAASGGTSYTVITLGCYFLAPDAQAGKFFEFYWHRFTGREEDPELQLSRIYDLLRGFNVRMAVCDYGMGHYQNKWLISHLGPARVVRLQFAGKQNAGKLVWRPKLGWYTGHKSAVCSDYISAIKERKILLPEWTSFANPYGEDFTNLRGEYNARMNETRYINHAGSTVDSFFSGLYCLVASMRDYPRPDITSLVVDYEDADPMALEDPSGLAWMTT